MSLKIILLILSEKPIPRRQPDMGFINIKSDYIADSRFSG